MAQKVQTMFIDDLKGTEAEDTFVSGWTVPSTGST
jgi:hypothetical protein